jgi:hypothetical protein
VEYTVVCNKFLSDTVKQVNDLMARGWRPVGGIHSSYQTEWAQALVRAPSFARGPEPQPAEPK